jgi:RNA-directed DNA polymerase
MMNNFTWWGIIRMLRHHWSWNDVRRRFIDPTAGGIQSRQMSGYLACFRDLDFRRKLQ